MRQFISQLFDTSDFPARWECGSWTAFHGWLHIVSDLLIWGAYMAIPLMLAYFVLKRKDVAFPRVFWLFVAFILSCGIGHLVEAGIFYWPAYRVSGLLKVCTAFVSWGTVVALVQVLPRALALPGLAEVNKRLEAEARDRKQAELQLQQVNTELEERVAQRAQSLANSVQQLKAEIERREQAEIALRESEERFRLMAENIDAVFWMRSGDGREQLYVSPKYATIWQRSLESLRENPDSFTDSVHPEDLPRLLQSFAELKAGTDPRQYDVEYRIIRPDGQTRWIYDRGFPIQDSDGKVMRQVGIAEDITERKQAALERDQALAQIRLVNDTMPAVIAFVDKDQRLRYANREYERRAHRRTEEMIGESIAEILNPEAYELRRPYIERALAGEATVSQTDVAFAGQSSCMLEITYVPQLGPNGVVDGFFVLAVDLSQRLEAERQRDKALARFESIAEHMPDCFWSARIDEDGNYIVEYVSPGWKQIWGYEAEDLYEDGELWLRSIVDEDREVVAETNESAARLGERRELNYRIRSRGGNVRWIEDQISPKFDRSGALVGIEGIARDITGRVQAEEHLRWTQFSVDHSADGIFWADMEAKFIYVNESAVHMTGYVRDELLQMSIFDIDPVLPRDDWHDLWEQAESTSPLVIESKSRRKDGSEFPVELSLAVMRYDDKQGFLVGFARDITDRKATEHALARRAEFKRLLLELSSRFITNDPREVDQATNQALATIGHFAEADRSYLFEFSADRTTATNTYEWCADEVEPHSENLQHVPVEAFPWMTQQLLAGETVEFTSLDDLPPDGTAEFVARSFSADETGSEVRRDGACIDAPRSAQCV